MKYELVSEVDFDGFPVEPERKWLALEAKCRSRLNELITEHSEAAADGFLRLQYMNTVYAAAEALGISGIDVPPDTENNFSHFLMSVTKVATKLRLKTTTARSAFSVELRRTTKVRLFSEIDRLRAIVLGSELDAKTKDRLTEKLSELELIISSPRSDFARVMAILGYVGMFVAGTTSTLADGPNAIATITAIFGEEKAEEDRENQLIEQMKRPLQIEDRRSQTALDDEIPF